MKSLLLATLLIFLSHKSFGLDTNFDQNGMHATSILLEKAKDDLYVGVKCGLTIEYSLMNNLYQFLLHKTHPLSSGNETYYSESMCHPEDRHWITARINEYLLKIDSFIPPTLMIYSVFFLSISLSVIAIKYMRSPYGASSLSLHEITDQSKSFSELLMRLKNIPQPSFTDAVIKHAIAEEIVFRLILQAAAYYMAKTIVSNIYTDEDSIDFIEECSYYSSIAFASIMFGLAHLINPNPQVAAVIYATIGGIYIGNAFHTNGIISSTACHSVANAFGMAVRSIILNSLSLIPPIIARYQQFNMRRPLRLSYAQ